MRIYLVRHGDAVPEEEAGSDRDRWLSGRGREAARVLGRLLREQQIVPDAILCSPLPRAVQTAELLAGSLDFLGTILSRRCFEPGAQPKVASNEIHAAGRTVLIVSHEPAISTLGAF
ncbi:MAG: histidine phosphatase family protein, partial [Deltaproteobacteria bacterium]|nr:histidine phosphatase family protein [Deltaproteobacteria bacterium]